MLILIIIFVLLCVVINFSLRAKGWRSPRLDHFDGRKFHNFCPDFWNRPVDKKEPVEVLQYDLGFDFFFKLFFSRWRARPLPDGLAYPAARILGREIVVTFVNHSTVLIQTEGVNILTDPVWATRASPFPFFGPKRYMPPGVALADLPKIDLVLLSHNHYDHLDVKALRKICDGTSRRFSPRSATAAICTTRKISGAHDLDWGQSRKFSDLVSVECVPAQHFSSRALTDRNKTLWGGFVISTPHGDIYFAGDTGYGPFAAHIRKKYPDGFRLAFLPIGAFAPSKNDAQNAHVAGGRCATLQRFEGGARRADPLWHFPAGA